MKIVTWTLKKRLKRIKQTHIWKTCLPRRQRKRGIIEKWVWGTKCDSRGSKKINVLRKLSVIRSAWRTPNSKNSYPSKSTQISSNYTQEERVFHWQLWKTKEKPKWKVYTCMYINMYVYPYARTFSSIFLCWVSCLNIYVYMHIQIPSFRYFWGQHLVAAPFVYFRSNSCLFLCFDKCISPAASHSQTSANRWGGRSLHFICFSICPEWEL